MSTINTEPNKVQNCIIITGMSGSGKSTTLDILEDQGLFAIDNIPPALLPQLLNVLSSHRTAVVNGVVAVVDIRGENLLDDFVSVMENLRHEIDRITIVFLDTSDEVLIRRYDTTRRRHPLGGGASILEGIQRERELLRPILDRADVIIDTSPLGVTELREVLLPRLGRKTMSLSIVFSSFGFKYGIPQDCDYIFDVRFLPNPHYISSLRLKSGRDHDVQQYIRSFKNTEEFLIKCYDFIDFIIPLYKNTGKPHLHIGIGCTGGRHRSVAVTEWLGVHVKKIDSSCVIRHRDINRDQVL